VSFWFRSSWILDPRGDLMAHAAFYYQIHVLIALALFALWPFTRLVHAFSAPIAYLFRPYIVYRSRDVADKHQLVGSAPRRRGWAGHLPGLRVHPPVRLLSPPLPESPSCHFATSPSSPTSTTAKPPWSTRCCGSPAP